MNRSAFANQDKLQVTSRFWMPVAAKASHGSATVNGWDNQLPQLSEAGSTDPFRVVCVAPGTDLLEVGDECMDANFNLLGECKDSYCDVLGEKKCVARKADGETCISGDECVSGACDSGVCGASTYCVGP